MSQPPINPNENEDDILMKPTNNDMKKMALNDSSKPTNRTFALKDDEFNKLCFALAFDKVTDQQKQRLFDIKAQDEEMYNTILFRASTIDKNDFKNMEDALNQHYDFINDLCERSKITKLPNTISSQLTDTE